MYIGTRLRGDSRLGGGRGSSHRLDILRGGSCLSEDINEFTKRTDVNGKITTRAIFSQREFFPSISPRPLGLIMTAVSSGASIGPAGP